MAGSVAPISMMRIGLTASCSPGASWRADTVDEGLTIRGTIVTKAPFVDGRGTCPGQRFASWRSSQEFCSAAHVNKNKDNPGFSRMGSVDRRCCGEGQETVVHGRRPLCAF